MSMGREGSGEKPPITRARGLCHLRAEFLAKAGRTFDHITGTWCESPIEELFLGAAFAQGFESNATSAPGDVELLRSVGIDCAGRYLRHDCEGWVLGVQAKAVGASIRADFVIVGDHQRPPIRIWIELDGHDFHERTPEQATRDKSRDRELTSNGWRVLRFTGREIMRAPCDCVEDALDVARAVFHESLAATP